MKLNFIDSVVRQIKDIIEVNILFIAATNCLIGRDIDDIYLIQLNFISGYGCVHINVRGNLRMYQTKRSRVIKMRVEPYVEL